MKFTKEVIKTIKDYILDQIHKYPNDITTVTQKHFQISKPTVQKYIRELIEQNYIQKTGKGRYPAYTLVSEEYEYTYNNIDQLEEDVVWRQNVSGKLKKVKYNIKEICQYGFTEMVNNVIDHSGAIQMDISLKINHAEIEINIKDNGIGIFKKIQTDLGLENPKHSILELAKGKFTSDPENHTGEGVFFTSRVFDHFIIISRNLRFYGYELDHDWLLEDDIDYEGTWIIMKISKQSELALKDVFDEFADPDKIPGFHKTVIPIRLMQYEGESLLSRSQAKRLITRFENFLDVILDFDGVNIIGQAFADEIFRVFNNKFPHVNISYVNANTNVLRMIKRASAKRE